MWGTNGAPFSEMCSHLIFQSVSFSLWLSSEVSAYNAGDLGSIPGLGRSPEEGKGYALQYSDLENFMDCIVHGVAKSRTRPSDFHFASLRDASLCFITVLQPIYGS